MSSTSASQDRKMAWIKQDNHEGSKARLDTQELKNLVDSGKTLRDTRLDDEFFLDDKDLDGEIDETWQNIELTSFILCSYKIPLDVQAPAFKCQLPLLTTADETISPPHTTTITKTKPTSSHEKRQKLDDLMTSKVPDEIEELVGALVINEDKNQLANIVHDAVADFILPHIHSIVLHVLRTEQISLTTTLRLYTTNITILELKAKLLDMMSNDPDSIKGEINISHYYALCNFVEQDKRIAKKESCNDEKLKKRACDDQDPPKNHEGEKKYKNHNQAGESSSRKQQVTFESTDYETQPSSTDKSRKYKELFSKAADKDYDWDDELNEHS
ncbi:hypothetical protein Tco_0579192 [Tanacetum coccineum]